MSFGGVLDSYIASRAYRLPRAGKALTIELPTGLGKLNTPLHHILALSWGAVHNCIFTKDRIPTLVDGVLFPQLQWKFSEIHDCMSVGYHDARAE